MPLSLVCNTMLRALTNRAILRMLVEAVLALKHAPHRKLPMRMARRIIGELAVVAAAFPLPPFMIIGAALLLAMLTSRVSALGSP